MPAPTDLQPETKPRLRFNPRITLLVIILILAISAAVILTDILSPRNRNPQPPTTPTTQHPI